MKIKGFIRANGSVGIRNYVLIISASRASHMLTTKIAQNVMGTKPFVASDEDGKSSQDRETMSRVFIGLGCNPNVSSVLIVCNKEEGGYKELLPIHLATEIRKTGKRVEILSVEKCGGIYQALGYGIKVARRLVIEASEVERTEVDFGKLMIGVKCGLSDASSGISGNPTVGYMADRLIDDGGTVVFSETTEVIGAEDILAKRCANNMVRKEFMDAVYRTEEEAKLTGEDIRTINPIPANIEAGITTLEEKSLGAMAKTGSREIKGVLKYAQRPKEKGLYFMDSWMSSTSLFLGYAAAGANLAIFQMGGGALPADPPMPAVATGLVTPVFYTTGNPRTYNRAMDEIDFNAGSVIEEKELISDAGERLITHLGKVANGKMTKMESYAYQDPIEIFLKGPNL